jgi:hypothetical protein
MNRMTSQRPLRLGVKLLLSNYHVTQITLYPLIVVIAFIRD